MNGMQERSDATSRYHYSGIPGSNLTFLQILATVAFLSSSGLITWIPQTVYFGAYPLLGLLFSFSVLHFLVVASVR